MVFAEDQTFKVEIKRRPLADNSYVDVSSYVVDDSILNLTVDPSISGGTIIFDKSILDILPGLDSQDEIAMTLGDSTPDTLVFTGIIDKNRDDDNDNTLSWSFFNYAKLTTNRRATEVYRNDAGTGDPRFVVTDLIDKYLPELTYDITSIPNTPVGVELFTNYRKQDELLKGIFDFIAGYLGGRIWYVDENKKFWMVVQNFTDSGYTLQTGSSGNIIGNLVVAKDTTKWGNVVSVNGKVFQVGFRDTFAGDGSTVKFDLSARPVSSTVEVDDTPKSGSIGGTDFSDDADYIIDPDEPSITFKSPPIAGASGVINSFKNSKIYDQQGDYFSVNKYGIRHIKITDDNIETKKKATEIALNYLVLNGVPIEIYSGKTVWNAAVLPLNKVRLIDTVGKRNINRDVNVIQTTIIFGKKSFDIRFKLNDFDFIINDLYEDLVNRVIRLELKERTGGDEIAKYLLFGAGFAVAIDNLTITSEGITTAFTYDDPDHGYDDASSYYDGNAGAGLIDEGEVVVVNLDDTWTEEFRFDNFEGEISAGSPVWNTTTHEWTFVNADKQRTKIFQKNGEIYSQALLEITGTDLGNLIFRLSGDGGVSVEAATNNTLHVFSTATDDGLLLEVEATGNATITKIRCRGEV